MAGVRPLSAATITSGVDWKAPRVVLTILSIAFWYSPSTPVLPFQVSSVWCPPSGSFLLLQGEFRNC